MPIPIGRNGFITNPGVSEPYILVEDDSEGTGGCYIFSFENANHTGRGFDNWVLPEALEQFFAESGWQVEWDKA